MAESIHIKLENLEKELKEIKQMMRSREKFFKAAGGWKNLDTEKLKNQLQKAGPSS
ncbi:MAG: hypothetical protein ACOC5L_05115 [Halobacteriota archaeon]